MHFFIDVNTVVCGGCRDWTQPVLTACQSRRGAHGWLGRQ
jgi:hypothetical protein